jgi:hypothetical protein
VDHAAAQGCLTFKVKVPAQGLRFAQLVPTLQTPTMYVLGTTENEKVAAVADVWFDTTRNGEPVAAARRR